MQTFLCLGKNADMSPFRPFVYMNTMKTHQKMETFENGDLSGDLKNGDMKNGLKCTCKHSKRIHAFDINVPQPSYS